MDLTIINWMLAILPVVVLLYGILFLKWEAAKVGAISWFVAVVVAITRFGFDFRLLALANSKGMSLSIYVLLIIWGAVFLYSIADKAGAIKSIGSMLAGISDEKRIQFLLLSWCFTSLLQGLAGFGVPVAVVAPIMIAMGFDPVSALAACLVGHSWSISFGSMGSSYNAIQLVTKIPGEIIGPQMALLFIIGISFTGFAVMHIYGGWKAVRKSVFEILSTSAAMSFGLWFMNRIGAAQLASLIAAICGCIVLGIWSFIYRQKNKRNAQSIMLETEKPYAGMKSGVASAPYLILIFLSVISQIKVIKAALSMYSIGLDYPKTTTAYGYVVDASKDFSKIQLFSHPAPILLVSALLGYLIYVKVAHADKSILKQAAKNTVNKCIPTSIGIITMVMMASIMSDAGMTNLIARGIASVLGNFYPLASPFLGVLGTFITGSNTNSNVMFGMLQYETATLLGKSAVLIAAAQSVGGSLGVSISPSTIMMGSANAGLSGSESKIMKKTIGYCLITTLAVGVAVMIFA